MSRHLLSKALFLAVTVLAMMSIFSHKTSAAFSANNLIDDGVFDNHNSMSVAQINSFLNGFTYSCISTNSGFEATIPTGYSPSTGYSYGGYASAGDIIATAAQTYEINPRVLLVTLEKEQSLVTGRNSASYCSPGASSNHKYASATGYGCPDSGTSHAYSGLSLYRRNGAVQTEVNPTCVNSASKAGFSQQVIRAAWLLKFGQQRSKGNTGWDIQKPGWDNSDDPLTCYGGPMTQGYRKRCANDASAVYYDGYTTIDGSSTHMDTGPTAALYWYTPHFHGNQNFVSLYESWFGPTKGVDYSWQFAGIYFSTGSANVKGHTKVTINMVAKNTGNQSWSNTNYPVRLGTFAPTNHNSALYDATWVSNTRLATVSPSIVLPGDYGTFTFVVNIPNIQGLYTERFNLVAEGSTWFPDPDFSIELAITKATYKWSMVSQSSSAGFQMAPGSTSQFTVVAKNTGNTTWSTTTNPVRMATWNPSYRSSIFYDTSWVSTTRTAVLQDPDGSVAPGENGTFVFTVKAPNTPGFYVERFNLVAEGLAWFEDPWMEFDIHVGNFYKWQMVSQNSSTGSFVMAMNATATYTLTVRNTSNTTWSNSTNPIRLATWAPSYRTSVFNPNDSSWPSQFRAATLNQGSVAPNQTGTFTFTVKAPSHPGLYIERFNLVAEGLAWFEDPWMEFDIIVQ